MEEDPYILQIIPATDWYVVYTDDEEEDGENIIPVACWVLMESGNPTNRYVDAIDSLSVIPIGGEFCSQIGNFKRFQYGKEKK
jgi:hypothetical protein